MPLPQKLMNSLFLLVLAAGYAAALANLYLTSNDVNGDGISDVQDVIAKFHGDPSTTKLTIAINTTMREHVADTEELIVERIALITDWVVAGAPEAQYDAEIAPIISSQCLVCHDLFGEAEEYPLTTFEEVTAYTVASTGKSWQALAELSHQHLLGMSFIFFLGGVVLFQVPGRMWLKSGLVSMGLLAILVDIASWNLTKIEPMFAYTVMLGGMAHTAAFAGIFAVGMWEMWAGGAGKDKAFGLE